MRFFVGELMAKPIILLTGARFVGKLSRDSVSLSNKLLAGTAYRDLNTDIRVFLRTCITIFVSLQCRRRKRVVNHLNVPVIQYAVMMKFRKIHKFVNPQTLRAIRSNPTRYLVFKNFILVKFI